MTDKLIRPFRNAVYQSFQKRSDAVLDLIDALTVADHASSPVAVSEEAFFRRKFSLVYDTLSHAVIDLDALLHTWLAFQPEDSQKIAGYEVYGLDATKDERPDDVDMCPLAYWQLLLMRDRVEADRPAWYPRFRDGEPRQLTFEFSNRNSVIFHKLFQGPAGFSQMFRAVE